MANGNWWVNPSISISQNKSKLLFEKDQIQLQKIVTTLYALNPNF